MFQKVLKVLIVFAALRLVLMAFVPVFEPSEARYAAIAANMARSGDFLVPRFTYDNVYQSFDGKPPLVFQAGGRAIRFLDARSPAMLQLAVRLCPFVSALLLLAILYWCVGGLAGREAGTLAVVICASMTAFYAASGIAMTDMTLTAAVAGALLVHRRFRHSPTFARAAAVAALLAAGMLTKGPVALVLFALALGADALVNRQWKAVFDWRYLAAAGVFIALAAPWFVLMERANPGSAWYFFYNENFLRFVSHDYGDRYGAGREAFRGVAVVWLFVATLPWSLVPVVNAFRRGHRLEFFRSWRSFEFLAFAAMTLFWCLTSRVLLYYLFPAIPLFAAYLAIHGDRSRLWRLAPLALLVTAAVTTLTLAGGAALSEKMRGAATPFDPLENHYAYEFYHGTPAPEKLAAAAAEKAERKAERQRRKQAAAELERLRKAAGEVR